MNFRSGQPHSFGKRSFLDFIDDRVKKVVTEIESQKKDYILSVDEDEYKSYLFETYKLESLTLFKDSEEKEMPKAVKIQRIDQFRGQKYIVEGYECTVKYQFDGSPVLFELSPTRRTLTGYPISVDAATHTVSFKFSIDRQDPALYERMKDEAFRNAFANLENVNVDVSGWNTSLSRLIDEAFKKTKNKYVGENSFFEAIKVKVDPGTKSVFTPPTVKKRPVPQPVAPKKEFTSSPTMNNEMYQDTLTVLYDFGRSMERKPSMYVGKDEESIRDLLLAILETRYVGTTATGETFNKNGKTDILLKYQDGSNLFVGECKWWKGEKEFNEAINQLFDNYLTWRDSKTALLFFVSNKEISKVCDKMKEAAQNHAYFKRFVGSKSDGRFSFIFHLPGDVDKEVFLEIITFHFNS